MAWKKTILITMTHRKQKENCNFYLVVAFRENQLFVFLSVVYIFNTSGLLAHQNMEGGGRRKVIEVALLELFRKEAADQSTASAAEEAKKKKNPAGGHRKKGQGGGGSVGFDKRQLLEKLNTSSVAAGGKGEENVVAKEEEEEESQARVRVDERALGAALKGLVSRGVLRVHQGRWCLAPQAPTPSPDGSGQEAADDDGHPADEEEEEPPTTSARERKKNKKVVHLYFCIYFYIVCMVIDSLFNMLVVCSPSSGRSCRTGYRRWCRGSSTWARLAMPKTRPSSRRTPSP
jgi:hypothetical protein